MAELNDDERELIVWVQSLATAAKLSNAHTDNFAGWRYQSIGDMLLRLGRLFTPQALPAGELGEMGRCYLNATLYDIDHPEAFYVEGLAIRTGCLGISVEHAWCATSTAALDPTWPDGAAYLGIPVTSAWRRARQQETKCVSLLWGESAITLLRDGIPDDALAAVGRPVLMIGLSEPGLIRLFSADQQ